MYMRTNLALADVRKLRLGLQGQQRGSNFPVHPRLMCPKMPLQQIYYNHTTERKLTRLEYIRVSIRLIKLFSADETSLRELGEILS